MRPGGGFERSLCGRIGRCMIADASVMQAMGVGTVSGGTSTLCCTLCSTLFFTLCSGGVGCCNHCRLPGGKSHF
jgi:hypothetical protein